MTFTQITIPLGNIRKMVYITIMLFLVKRQRYKPIPLMIQCIIHKSRFGATTRGDWIGYADQHLSRVSVDTLTVHTCKLFTGKYTVGQTIHNSRLGAMIGYQLNQPGIKN